MDTSPSTTTNTPTAVSPTSRRRGGSSFTAWPLWAVAAGVAGFAATVLTDSRPPAEGRFTDYTVRKADVLTVDQSTLFVSMVLGYLAVVCLLVLAGAWRRHVESAGRASTAANVVTFGLVAGAGALALAYGWRGALANYLPGGVDEGAFDTDGLFVYFMLSDFGPYIAWVPVVVSLGALAWMSLRERVISRWIGALNLFYVVLIGGAVVVTGVPGLPGTLAAPFLAVTGLGLAFGRSAITRPEPAPAAR